MVRGPWQCRMALRAAIPHVPRTLRHSARYLSSYSSFDNHDPSLFPDQSQVTGTKPCTIVEGSPTHCHGLTQRTVKQGPNSGRLFWACGLDMDDDCKCNHFEWDNPDDGPQGPQCAQGLQCRTVLRVVKKEGPNTGRHFWVCGRPQDDPTRCANMFQWASENPAAPCAMNKPVAACAGGVLRQVKKEGPNKGKKFYCCPAPIDQQCGLFIWVDEGQHGDLQQQWAPDQDHGLSSQMDNQQQHQTSSSPTSDHSLSSPTPF